MKKLFVLFAVLLAAMFVVACASKPPAGPTAADSVAEAKSAAPSGTLVGMATVKGTKDTGPAAQRKAQENAMNQIKRGLTSIAGDLVDAQVQSGRVSNSVSGDLKQNIAAAIDVGPVPGAQRVDSGVDAAFTGWAVYSLDKAGALQVVTSAANAAKEKVAAANFNPSNGFDDVFAKAAAREWK